MTASQARLSDRLRDFGRRSIHFLTSAVFVHNLIALVGAGLFFVLFVGWWLRCYTHHGERLSVENYVGALIQDAEKDARSKNFLLVVEDSLFVVGQPGGVILAQNPSPGAEVKEGRRIYVTTTKYDADEIAFSSLPAMYGQEVNGLRKTLKQRFQIETRIVAEVFDEGPPQVVLAVIYEGDTLVDARRKLDRGGVPKGATLGLIISKNISEYVSLPDVECKKFSDADFLIQASWLRWGTIHLDENVTQRSTAWIYRQEPAFTPGVLMNKGDTLTIWLTQARPARCPVGAEELLD